MLAPAILAGGLMVGEGVGYDGGRIAGDRVPPGVGLAFEPVYVPAPARADLVYEGSLPAPRKQEEVRVRVVDVPVPVVPPAGESVVRREVPAPVRGEREREQEQGSGCPGEWEETWLWELCREREQAPA